MFKALMTLFPQGGKTQLSVDQSVLRFTVSRRHEEEADSYVGRKTDRTILGQNKIGEKECVSKVGEKASISLLPLNHHIQCCFHSAGVWLLTKTMVFTIADSEH